MYFAYANAKKLKGTHYEGLIKSIYHKSINAKQRSDNLNEADAQLATNAWQSCI